MSADLVTGGPRPNLKTRATLRGRLRGRFSHTPGPSSRVRGGFGPLGIDVTPIAVVIDLGALAAAHSVTL